MAEKAQKYGTMYFLSEGLDQLFYLSTSDWDNYDEHLLNVSKQELEEGSIPQSEDLNSCPLETVLDKKFDCNGLTEQGIIFLGREIKPYVTIAIKNNLSKETFKNHCEKLYFSYRKKSDNDLSITDFIKRVDQNPNFGIFDASIAAAHAVPEAMNALAYVYSERIKMGVPLTLFHLYQLNKSI